MQKWEYKVTGWLNEAEMNQLGADGWELVAVDARWERFFFKRPR